MTIIDFKDYILRKLGYPLHSIEITQEQIFDCITEATQKFIGRHYDGVIMNVYKLQLQSGQSEYRLPDYIKTVINILPSNILTSSLSSYENYLVPLSPIACFDYLFQISDITTVMNQRYSTQLWEDNLYNQNIMFDFNSSMHKLNILGNINSIAEKFPTDSFFLVTYDSPDETLEDLYNNLWLKSYAVALCKKQWATNLMKYNGASLAGGAELNYEGILNEAKEEIASLNEQLEDEFTLPPSFLVG